MTNTKTAAVTEITVNVKVESITSFWRYNQWSHRRELQHCVSMSTVGEPDLPWYVTFTNSRFINEIEEGGMYTISCKHKRMQDYNGKVQEVVTHCKIAV